MLGLRSSSWDSAGCFPLHHHFLSYTLQSFLLIILAIIYIIYISSATGRQR